MSNPLIAKYNIAGTYTIEVETGLYRLTLVGGGGNAYYATTGDADGGYAYTRGWGGGSGGAFSGVVSLPKGTYTVVIGGVTGSSYITDSTGEPVLSVGGGGNAAKWAVGTAGTAPTVNPNYNVLETTINKAGNAGLTAKGDWGGGYGTGGASVYSSYGTGASINSDGSWGRTDGGFELLTYTASKYNKFYALKKDVFDISKVTVVGSPTITSEGVASGFSLNNCLMIDTSNIDWTKPYKIKVKVNTGTTANQNGNITCYNMPIIRINDRYLQFSPSATYSSISTLGSIKDTTTVSNNTDYYLIATFDGTTYTFEKSLDDKNYTLIGTSTTIVTNLSTGGTSTIGTGYGVLNDQNRAWDGSIDLKEFKIYVDDQLIYTPTEPTYLLERRKKGYDPSKFTVVGSPTITEEGVASGFGSHSEMIKTIKASELLNKSWAIKVVCNGKGGSLSNPISFTTTYGNASSGGIQSAYSPAHLYLNLKTGDSVDTQQLAFNNTYAMLNIPSDYRSADVVLTFSFDIQTGSYTWSLRKISETTAYKTITYTPTSTNKQLYEITTNTDAYIAINSTLSNVIYNAEELYDLTQFSITVDGKEVFTGAKEQFYMLRR